MDKLCPMKFNLMTSQSLTEKLVILGTLETALLCDKESCAWYCDYGNGMGDCTLAMIPALNDMLDQISTDIRQK